MDHDGAVETSALQCDMLREDGVGAQRGQVDRLRFKVVLSEKLFLFNSEVNLSFFKPVENFRQACALHFVLEGLSVPIALKVPV